MTEYEVRIVSTGEVIYVTDVNVKRASIDTIDTSLVDALAQGISAFKVYEDVASVHADEHRAWLALCNDVKALADARDLMQCADAKVRMEEVAESIAHHFNTAMDGRTIVIAISSRSLAVPACVTDMG